METITIPRSVIDPSYKILTWKEIVADIIVKEKHIAEINEQLRSITNDYITKILTDHRYNLCQECNKLLAMMEE